MRHVLSLFLALLLAPLIWVLTGAGLSRTMTGRAGLDGPTAEMWFGYALLLLAGAAYALLVLPRLSPGGPLLAGTAFLAASAWMLLDRLSFYGSLPRGTVGGDYDLPLPAHGLAVLLAVPLLATVVNPRRWRRYDRPSAALVAAPPYPPPYRHPPYSPPPTLAGSSEPTTGWPAGAELTMRLSSGAAAEIRPPAEPDAGSVGGSGGPAPNADRDGAERTRALPVALADPDGSGAERTRALPVPLADPDPDGAATTPLITPSPPLAPRVPGASPAPAGPGEETTRIVTAPPRPTTAPPPVRDEETTRIVTAPPRPTTAPPPVRGEETTRIVTAPPRPTTAPPTPRDEETTRNITPPPRRAMVGPAGAAGDRDEVTRPLVVGGQSDAEQTAALTVGTGSAPQAQRSVSLHLHLPAFSGGGPTGSDGDGADVADAAARRTAGRPDRPHGRGGDGGSQAAEPAAAPVTIRPDDHRPARPDQAGPDQAGPR